VNEVSEASCQGSGVKRDRDSLNPSKISSDPPINRLNFGFEQLEITDTVSRVRNHGSVSENKLKNNYKK
jgi:hypothetical protein